MRTESLGKNVALRVDFTDAQTPHGSDHFDGQRSFPFFPFLGYSLICNYHGEMWKWGNSRFKSRYGNKSLFHDHHSEAVKFSCIVHIPAVHSLNPKKDVSPSSPHETRNARRRRIVLAQPSLGMKPHSIVVPHITHCTSLHSLLVLQWRIQGSGDFYFYNSNSTASSSVMMLSGPFLTMRVMTS